MSNYFFVLSRQVLLSSLLLIASCSTRSSNLPNESSSVQLSKSITLYDWAGYMPSSILEQFETEFGIHVDYQTYDSQEDAAANLRAGQTYDVVVLDGVFISPLIEEELLAPLNYQNIPNFRYVSPNFRDLSYDPGNRYSIMLQWGITALLMRSDKVDTNLNSWNALWEDAYRDKVGVWAIQRPLIGIVLKSLGYSANSEKPDELSKARVRLRELKEHSQSMDLQLPNMVPMLATGEIWLAYGWSFDILAGREQHPAIAYVLPKEGPLVWGDNVVIPANSPNKETGELFINFLFRPDISAQITNEIYIATPNEEANKYINSEILNDQAIFPPNDALRNAEMILPLAPAAQKIYDEMWQEFLGDVKQ